MGGLGIGEGKNFLDAQSNSAITSQSLQLLLLSQSSPKPSPQQCWYLTGIEQPTTPAIPKGAAAAKPGLAGSPLGVEQSLYEGERGTTSGFWAFPGSASHWVAPGRAGNSLRLCSPWEPLPLEGR
jgi:hypothetical protein